MPAKLNAYISFDGNAREAMEFYQSVFGGNLMLTTFKEFQASQDPAEDDKVMHAYLEAENGISLMAADTPRSMSYTPGDNFSLALSGDDVDELTAYFEKLGAGGSVVMPLEKAPWGDTFGMVKDRYGVQWLVNIAGDSSTAS